MHFQHSPDAPIAQRSAVVHDELLAVCRYKFLRLMNMHSRVTLKWLGEDWTWCTGPLSWKTVYDRGGESLLYILDDGFAQWCPPFDWLSCEKLGSFVHTLDLLEPVADDWREVLKKYRAWSLSSYVTARVAQGKRSDVIYKVAKTLDERGASAAEIACVLSESKCWQSKHGNNQRALKAEVARIMRKPHGKH